VRNFALFEGKNVGMILKKAEKGRGFEPLRGNRSFFLGRKHRFLHWKTSFSGLENIVFRLRKHRFLPKENVFSAQGKRFIGLFGNAILACGALSRTKQTERVGRHDF